MILKYAAKTRDGLSVKRGEIDAPNHDSAVKWLRERDLVVYSLTEVKQTGGFLSLLFGSRGVSISEKVRFTDQLGSMITAGLPLTKALELIASQTKSKRMGEITQNLLNEVESGSPFAKALEKYTDVFTKSYVSLIKAGEASGQLDNVLVKLASNLEKQRQFRSKVKSALVYPAVISVAMVGVFILVVVFLIPRMTSVYTSFNVELPITTKIMIKISDLAIGYYAPILGLLVISLIALRVFYKTPLGNEIFTRFIFAIPVIGKVSRESNIVEFTRTLGLLTEAGVSLVESLEIIRDGINNNIYKLSIEGVLEGVKRGIPVSQSTTKDPNFPPFVSQMLMVGEETGTVDKRLNALAEYYEGEIDKVVKNLSTIMEPLIMIMLGCLVGLLVVSVILPIYQLTASIS